jgi:hypothetical protein
MSEEVHINYRGKRLVRFHQIIIIRIAFSFETQLYPCLGLSYSSSPPPCDSFLFFLLF